MSLTSYYREAFTEAEVITVVAPWWFGESRVVLWVRPDSVSPFESAREACGVAAPETLEERSRKQSAELAKTRAEQARGIVAKMTKQGRGSVANQLAPAIQLMEDFAEEAAGGEDLPEATDLAAEGWDMRYPVYLREEVASLATAAGMHLVAKMGLCRLDEDGDPLLEEVVLWDAEGIKEAFGEQSPLPVAFPEHPEEPVKFAGMPESAAWATVVLAAAVQRHRFQEATVPFVTASEEPGPSSGILSGERLLRTA